MTPCEFVTALRWRLFKLLSWISWRICPDPHRSRLYHSMSFDKDMWGKP